MPDTIGTAAETPRRDPKARETAVFYEDVVVGRLPLDREGRIAFAYDPRWLATPGAFPISTGVPLEDDVHGPDLVEPWLENLLPEEATLRALARAVGADHRDVHALLLSVGGDTAGAFSFGAPAKRSAWSYETLVERLRRKGDDVVIEETALAAHVEELRERPFLVGEEGVRVSLAGGQQKTALALVDPAGRPVLGLGLDRDDLRLAVARDGAPTTLIVKPDNPHLLGIVENEAYCLELARRIGLAAADWTIRRMGARTALVVARYDRRRRRDGGIRRIHQEDFAQALGVRPAWKYERGTVTGPSLADILGVGRRLDRPDDRLALIDYVIFNILIGNKDAHAKNYSLMLGGGVRVAPLYDVTSALPWPSVNQYFAQNIAGRKRKPVDVAGRHWSHIAVDARLNPRETRRRVRDLGDAIVAAGQRTAAAVAAVPGACAPIVEDVSARIDDHARRILGRLEK